MPSSLSCSEREQMAGSEIAAATSGADTSCMVDGDCVQAAVTVSCHDTCGSLVVSKAGQVELADASARIDRDVCGSFTADGCQYTLLPCVPPESVTPVCLNNRCNLMPTCRGCLSQTIEWGEAHGYEGYEYRSTLAPCASYTRSRVPALDQTSRR